MMFLLRRTLVVLLILVPCSSACALDVVYGPFFKIRGVELRQGRPVLPLTNKKYANVRILDEQTYRWLASCKTAVCSQPTVPGKTEVSFLRAAKTREGMWIADVAADGHWLLTVLVFANPQGYEVVVPNVILITQSAWREQIEKQVTQAVIRFREDEKNAM